MERRIPWLSIGLLSACALAYEVLLTRLFSLVHWHHLVAMIISLALLGYGASGSFLALLRHRLERVFTRVFIANALFFALGMPLGFELARRLPLNPQALPWEPRQLLYLSAVYSLVALPFFGVANCIGLTLWRFREAGHRIYAMDLLGAGLGAAGVLALLYIRHPSSALALVAATALAASLLGAVELIAPSRRGAALLLALIALAGLLAPPLDWRVPGADYKDLSRALRVTGARLDVEISDPTGTLSVLRNDRVPVRQAPGLSLLAGETPRRQRALFIDGDAAGVISAFDGASYPAYLAALTSALPYQLVDRPHALILGAGGGNALLQALALGAHRVTAVEPHAPLIELLRERYAAFNPILRSRGVSLQFADPRAFVESSRQRFDLIQIDRGDGGGIGGLKAQDEAYAYTVEAFAAYLSHLAPGGVLAFTRPLQLPPRESLKLVATARAALHDAGAARPAEHLALIRSWSTVTLIVGKSALRPAQLSAIRTFCTRYAFDPIWFPAIDEQSINRYTRLDHPWFYHGVKALLGPSADDFTAAYDFLIQPASDDRPYFFRFSRLTELPKYLSLPAGTGFGQVDWGYGFLLATLFQAMLLAVLFILLPLLLLRSPDAPTPWPLRWRILGYFAALGIGFMFIEIAFIQRFRLFLGHPVYATAVVLGGFLLFAGAGSYLSRRSAVDRQRRLGWIVGAIAAIAAAYLWLLPNLFQWLMHWPLGSKAAISLLLIAPLALGMGMPFPIGLAQLGEQAPALVPWAWAINGSASVVSAVAAPLIAMEWGFSGLVLIAILMYAAARNCGFGR